MALMERTFAQAETEESRKPDFEALSELLCRMDAEDVIRCADVLAGVIPELSPLIGFDQRSPHHAYDLITHTAQVVAQVPRERTLRWAALLHDIGKVPTFTQDATGRGHFYGHAGESAAMADRILGRLKAPEEVRSRVVLLIGQHMVRPVADKAFLAGQLEALGKTALMQLLALQWADMHSKGTGEPVEDYHRIYRLLEELT